MITRRRFLAISAATLASPAYAEPVRWQGRAMGANVSLTLETDPETARPVIEAVRATLDQFERLFSLYDPASTLSQLNGNGRLIDPDPVFLRLMANCDRLHKMTKGRFDPTIQPLWRALALGGDLHAAQALIGWEKVDLTSNSINLGAGQALTLNGIAQGFATDTVAGLLRDAGLTRVLVNIGELHGAGRAWRLGISDPKHGLVATHSLRDRAIATSSPGAMILGDDRHHIVDPSGKITPRWSTVSVEAKDATSADALSTALCYANATEIKEILDALPGHPLAICVATNGKVSQIEGQST